LVTHNADLLATVAPQLEAELAQQLAQKTFGEQGKGILKQSLAGHLQPSKQLLQGNWKMFQPFAW